MKNPLRSVFLMLFVAAVLGVVAMPAFADPPGVAGRLSYMQGPVSLQPGGVDDWIDATMNRPLTTSDRIWADQGGRAEVSMGNVVARIDQETSMTITNLDDNITQLELDQGSLFIHVRQLFEGESVEIDTPNVAFVLDRGGDYRFDVDPNNDTTYVSVRRGEGEGTGEAAGVRVRSGEQVVFSGGNSGQSQISQLGDMDEFDSWNQQRDDRTDRSASARYVSPGMVGYEDLDDYGSWSEDANYGPVWRPRVDAGWAPYHTGHWAWIDPWGYTWVDDAPWGYAPFHYGRWVSIGGGWGWCPGRPAVYVPGRAYVRPVYAPALVAFVGGGGFGVGITMGGGGPVGWVPLGWGEPYYPSYRVSENYVRNVNVTNTRIVNITNVTNNYTVINRGNTTVINNVRYANERAVVAVPANAMASGRPVREAAVRVDQAQLRQAKFMAAPPVAPQREAVLGGKAPVRQHVPPAQAFQRPVMTKSAPPPAPVRFEAKRQLLQRNNGRPLDTAQVQNLPREQRPAPMAAGKPRPAAAVQQINAAKPKGPAPTFRPAPARPAAGGPANAARPGNPAGPSNARPNEPANAARPNAPAAAPGKAARPNEPANAGRPNTPAGPGNVPRPNAPADNAGRPGNAPNAGAGPGNVPRPNAPADNAGRPGPDNQPNAGRPNVPRPPSATMPGRDNEGRPTSSVPRPPSSTTPAPGRNNEGSPSTGAPRPNQPQPGRGNDMNRPNAPADNAGRPGNPPNAGAGPRNVPRPNAPADNAGRPEPGNQPNAGRQNIPRPPARDANPGERPGGRPVSPAQPSRPAPEARSAPEPRPAAPAAQPARPAPEPRSAAPAQRPAPEARPAQPSARDNNVPRPPDHSAGQSRQSAPPPSRESKPAKDDKDKKDERPKH